MGFTVASKDVGEVSVFELSGELDSRSAPELESALLDSLAKERRNLLLDFSRLEFISSAGLRVLVMVGKRLAAEGGQLVLCALNAEVRQIFDLVGMSDLFVTRPSRGEALQWLSENAKVVQVSSLAAKLLGKGDGTGVPRHGASGQGDSERSSLAAELLGLERDAKPRS